MPLVAPSHWAKCAVSVCGPAAAAYSTGYILFFATNYQTNISGQVGSVIYKLLVVALVLYLLVALPLLPVWCSMKRGRQKHRRLTQSMVLLSRVSGLIKQVELVLHLDMGFSR